MAWDFIVTDLFGVPLGDAIKADSRTVTLPHLRTPSATFTIPLWDSLAPTLRNTDCLLKCYRTDPVLGTRTLAFNGPVVSVQGTAQTGEQSLSVTAAGPFWRLTKRLIPASKQTTGYSYGSLLALADLGTIARSIIQDTNAAAFGAGFTGIDLGTHTDATTGWVSRWYNKNVAEAIAELAAGINSFEFRVRMTEPTGYANVNGWPRIGLFDDAPIIGVTRPDAIFEYGTTRPNVDSYEDTVDRSSMINDAIVSVQGWPDGVERNTDLSLKYNQQERFDTTSINARGLFEEVVSDAGILDDTNRQKIGDYHVALRKNPLQRITFKPKVNARPAPLIDYDVGDTVRARAFIRGVTQFDALFRIWGVKFNIDTNGNEDVELELVMP